MQRLVRLHLPGFRADDGLDPDILCNLPGDSRAIPSNWLASRFGDAHFVLPRANPELALRLSSTTSSARGGCHWLGSEARFGLDACDNVGVLYVDLGLEDGKRGERCPYFSRRQHAHFSPCGLVSSLPG